MEMSLRDGSRFQLYVTHVEGEGPNLKVFGQVDKQRALAIETLLANSKISLERGLGLPTSVSIHLGLLCVAKYGDGDYYRAKVISVSDLPAGYVSVYFLDYGNNDIVHVTSIRVLNNFHEVFRTTPPQARDFLLARVAHPNGVWDASMQSEINKLIYYTEITCVVEVVAFEKYFIKMIHKDQDLSDYLTSQNFGVRTTVQEQRNLLHKVLSSAKNTEMGRMYIPPPARLAAAGYIPPQPQVPTTADVGRSVGSFSPQNRVKTRIVMPPRPLHRSVEESPSPPSIERATDAASLPLVPRATTLQPSAAAYRSRQLKENESYMVHVSYAKEGPKCFAIQLKSDEEFLSRVMSSINRGPPQPLTEPPILGSVCLGRFSEDKTLCRAVVVCPTESYCRLFFVDFGITENVSCGDVFQISENDVLPHVFASRFCLAGIQQLQITDKIKNDFYNIVNNQVLTLKVVPSETKSMIPYCELYVNGQCVKEMLMQRQNPTFSKIDPSCITGMHSVLVSYVDSCTKFYIQLSDNIDTLNQVMDIVAAHCKETPPLLYYQVRCGMSCCAIFPDDQSWYRAIVTNIRKDKITVNYVDYGNEQDLTCDVLRPITPELVSLKAQAVHCALRGFEDQPFDQRTCDSLEKLTLEKILTMGVHGVMEGGVLLVDLTDESVTPPLHIATAVHQCLIMSPPATTYQTSTPQLLEDEAVSSNQVMNTPSENVELSKENSSDTSFDSNKGKNDSFSSRLKKQYQDRGDRNRNEYAPGKGNRNDRKRDFGENVNKKHSKGNFTDSGPRYHTESKSQEFRLNRNSFSDSSSHAGSTKGSYYHQRDSKPEWSNKNQRGDGGWRSSERSGDKEFSGEKRTYGDRQSKPYKPRNQDNQDTCRKSLSNPVPFETVFNEQSIVFGVEHNVRVTWLINPNDFFVNIKSEEDSLRSIMVNVPNMYTGIRPAFSHEVSIGSCVLARFPEDKALYRAQVLDSQYGGKFKVQFIDYGNKCLVDGTDIWQLENELISVPKMAIHCSIKGIAPIDNKWGQDQTVDDILGSDSYKAIFHCTDNDRYSISLVGSSGDVGQLLIDKKLAVSTEKPTGPPATAVKVYVTHIDTPGQFWLQLDSDFDKINALQETLQGAEALEKCADREVGKLCISKYSADDQHYRTVILDADSDIITVRFIDYGNTDVLDNTPEVLKCLPTEMHDVEPYALKCSVNATPTGTGQWTEQASELFTTLLGNTEEAVDAVFVLKGATTYVDLFVNCVNITDNLVSQGLAVKSEKSDEQPTCFASHVNSPSEFWIQLESSVRDLEAIAEQLVNAQDFPPLAEIAEEVICAAKFPEDDLWYRAQVIIHGSDGTEVLFMDYGNASLTNELRSLPDHLNALPALSRKCALQKPSNIKNWSKEAELKFADLAADGATVFHVSFIASGDTSIVELYVESQPVTEQLSALCQVDATPIASPIRLPTIGSDDASLPVYICHSNSPEDFWIHYESSSDNLTFILSEMVNAANFQTLEDVSEGIICASIFSEDDLYYRSKVLCHGESGTEVLHIDYGSTAITSDLKELPKVLADIPGLAKHCSLEMPHDRSKINEEIHTKFAELAIDDSVEYKIEVINAETDPMIVKLSSGGRDFVEILGFKNECDKSVENKHTNNINIENSSVFNNDNESNEDGCAKESSGLLVESTTQVVEMTTSNTYEKSEISVNAATELDINNVNIGNALGINNQITTFENSSEHKVEIDCISVITLEGVDGYNKEKVKNEDSKGKVENDENDVNEKVENDDDVKEKVESDDDVKEKVENDDDVKEKVENNDDNREKVENDDDVKEKVENVDDVKEKVENDDDVKEKVDNVDDVKEKVENVDDVKEKVENIDDNREKVENDDDNREKVENDDDVKEKVENNDDNREKVENDDDVKEKVENNDDNREKVENNDDNREKVENDDDVKEKVENDDDVKEKVENNDDNKEKVENDDNTKNVENDDNKRKVENDHYTENVESEDDSSEKIKDESEKVGDKVQRIDNKQSIDNLVEDGGCGKLEKDNNVEIDKVQLKEKDIQNNKKEPEKSVEDTECGNIEKDKIRKIDNVQLKEKEILQKLEDDIGKMDDIVQLKGEAEKAVECNKSGKIDGVVKDSTLNGNENMAECVEDDSSNEQEFYEDEDKYSDVSDNSEPIDPVKQIKACLDACDNK